MYIHLYCHKLAIPSSYLDKCRKLMWSFPEWNGLNPDSLSDYIKYDIVGQDIWYNKPPTIGAVVLKHTLDL